jgi:gliding motility-associated lipoprotein GldD
MLLLLLACNNENPIPKPPTYLRADFPEHTYKKVSDNCPYAFDLSTIYEIKGVANQDGSATCHKDIYLGPLNGTIHFSYIPMEKSLADYVNFAINKVDEHKVKATAIEDTNFIRRDARVYGTLFEIQGDVASPFQFYLTDSTSKFVSGVVYFNSSPRYDSLKPSLDYLKKDLYRLIESFEWK